MNATASFYAFLTTYEGSDYEILDLGGQLKQDEDAPLEDVELYQHLITGGGCRRRLAPDHQEAVKHSWTAYQLRRAR